MGGAPANRVAVPAQGRTDVALQGGEEEDEEDDDEDDEEDEEWTNVPLNLNGIVYLVESIQHSHLYFHKQLRALCLCFHFY